MSEFLDFGGLKRLWKRTVERITGAAPGWAEITVERGPGFVENPKDSLVIVEGSTHGRWKELGHPTAGDIVRIKGLQDDTGGEGLTYEMTVLNVERWEYEGGASEYFCLLDYSQYDAQQQYLLMLFGAEPGSGELCQESDEIYYSDKMTECASYLWMGAYFTANATTESAKQSNLEQWQRLNSSSCAACFVRISDAGWYLCQYDKETKTATFNQGKIKRTYSINKTGDEVVVTLIHATDDDAISEAIANNAQAIAAASTQIASNAEAIAGATTMISNNTRAINNTDTRLNEVKADLTPSMVYVNSTLTGAEISEQIGKGDIPLFEGGHADTGTYPYSVSGRWSRDGRPHVGDKIHLMSKDGPQDGAWDLQIVATNLVINRAETVALSANGGVKAGRYWCVVSLLGNNGIAKYGIQLPQLEPGTTEFTLPDDCRRMCLSPVDALDLTEVREGLEDVTPGSVQITSPLTAAEFLERIGKEDIPINGHYYLDGRWNKDRVPRVGNVISLFPAEDPRAAQLIQILSVRNEGARDAERFRCTCMLQGGSGVAKYTLSFPRVDAGTTDGYLPEDCTQLTLSSDEVTEPAQPTTGRASMTIANADATALDQVTGPQLLEVEGPMTISGRWCTTGRPHVGDIVEISTPSVSGMAEATIQMVTQFEGTYVCLIDLSMGYDNARYCFGVPAVEPGADSVTVTLFNKIANP